MFDGVLEKRLTELIDDMDIKEQYILYKEYCIGDYYDDEPFSNDEYTINELYSNLTPIDLLNKFEGWNSSWDYFVETIYGIKEWNGIEYTSDVVDAIMNNWNSYENDYIQELLDLYDCDLDDYIDNLYEVDMTKEDLIDTVLDSLKSEFEDDYEEIMEQYGNEILKEISYYFED